MGRILIGNAKQYIDNLHECYTENGFQKYNQIALDDLYLYVYKKLRVDNINFLKVDDGYIAIAGTMIYKNLFGEESLRLAYSDFNGDVEQIRGNMLGNFCVCIMKDQTLFVFCDVAGSYSIHYHINKDTNEFLLTNMAYHIQTQYHFEPYYEFLEHYSRARTRINGDKSMFCNINRLLPNQVVKYNLKTRKVVVDKFDVDYSLGVINDDFESISQIFSDTFKDINFNIVKHFKKVNIFMTGGVDSRTILASSLANNFKPELFYWRGNTPLSNTKDDDLNICNIFSKKYDLKLNIVDIYQSEDEKTPNEELIKKYLPKFGELSRLLLRGESWIDILESKINANLILNGSDGENYRILENKNYESSCGNLQNFVDLALFNGNIEKYWKNTNKSIEEIYNVFKNICLDLNYDPNNLSCEEFENISVVSGMENWTDIVNICNMYFYHTHLFDQQPLLKITLNTPFQFKMHAKLMVKNLINLKADILDVPVFSACEKVVINKKTFEKKRTLYNTIALGINALMKENNLKKLARKLYKMSINDKKSFSEGEDNINIYNCLVKLIKSEKLYSNMDLELKELDDKGIYLDSRHMFFLLLNIYILKNSHLKNK